MNKNTLLVTHDVVVICTLNGTPLVTDTRTLNTIFDLAGAVNSNDKKVLDVLRTARAKLFNMKQEY